MRSVPQIGGPAAGVAQYLPNDLPVTMCSRQPGSLEWSHYCLAVGPVYLFTGMCADLGCTPFSEFKECDPPERYHNA
jgi:hypothetical protein